MVYPHGRADELRSAQRGPAAIRWYEFGAILLVCVLLMSLLTAVGIRLAYGEEGAGTVVEVHGQEAGYSAQRR
ncbi:hypothetical protein PA598K_01837 [Paenibacillus sp. 598K]|nr:hypothetical protein PA598K_01837 [Paenibacillus sp. 598K]